MGSLVKLILVFAEIGALSFGGGYASIGIVEKQVVEIHKWLTYSEFADIVAIDELTPGPVAINAATFIGTKMAGFPGAIAATLGVLLPSCVIVLVLARLYFKYKSMKTVNGAVLCLKSLVVAMILSTTLSILSSSLFNNDLGAQKSIDYFSIFLFVIALISIRKTKINPLLIMLGCGFVGAIVYSFI